MKILVINSGSSSIKYKLYAMDSGQTLASGQIERIGQAMSRVTHTAHRQGKDENIEKDLPVPDHKNGLGVIMRLLSDPPAGVIDHPDEIDAVGHRVVHGGDRFQKPALAKGEVLDDIRAAIPLAPLHNPANLAGIEAAHELFPNAAQVAVFDTAFHQTMPPRSYIYALPYELYEKYGIRRYGFHGISHHYVSRAAAIFLNKPIDELNLITLHLGGGGSVCAIEKGRSVDTSMGMTPLSGTIMGTRCGDIDPGIAIFLGKQAGYSIDDLDTTLNKKSGLFGICGAIDMRDIHARCKQGDTRAQLAFEMYGQAVRKYIGAYVAELGHVDALVFTAGIGEHDAATRWESCRKLQALGIVLDAQANATAPNAACRISAADSKVDVLVVPTDEEFEIARQTMELLATSQASKA